jgi:hypothetical protein
MDIKYLSRKFLLSVTLAVLGTIAMALKLIEPYQWQWLIMATVVSYVAAKTIEKKTFNAASGQIGWGKNGIEKGLIVTVWERLKSLCSREFLLTMGTVAVASVFLFMGIIPSVVWFTICTALAACFNIGTALAKV